MNRCRIEEMLEDKVHETHVLRSRVVGLRNALKTIDAELGDSQLVVDGNTITVHAFIERVMR